MTNFWKSVKEIHLDPRGFYETLGAEGFRKPSKFVATVGLIFGLLIPLFGLLGVITGEVNAASLAFISTVFLVFVPVILIFSALFQAGMAHIAVYLFGKRGFNTTYNAVAYPISATMLWGWIPVLNFVAGIYSLYLQAKGIEILHDMSFGKALIAAIWPLILSIVLMTALIFVFFLAGLGAALV